MRALNLPQAHTLLRQRSCYECSRGCRETRSVSDTVGLPSSTPEGRKFVGVIITNGGVVTLNDDSSDGAGELEIRCSYP
jgi:hypothetical protein